jgi:hypothetical protein
MNGLCDFTSGECSCLGAAQGPACDQLTFQLISSDDPALHLFVQKPDYAGNMLLIETVRAESLEFNFIMCLGNFNELFKVTGTGTVGLVACCRRRIAGQSLQSPCFADVHA